VVEPKNIESDNISTPGSLELDTLLNPSILDSSVMKEVCNPMVEKHGYENWNMVWPDESTDYPINSGLDHGQVS